MRVVLLVKMKTFHLIFIAIALSFACVVSSCSDSTENEKSSVSGLEGDNIEVVKKLKEGDGWSKWGATHPIQLKHGSTTLNLKDYLLYGEHIDSVKYFNVKSHSESLHFNSLKETEITHQPENGIGLLSLFVKQGVNSARRDIPVFASETKEVKIESSGGRLESAKNVSLAGSMNGWSSWKTPLEQGDNGIWTVTLNLPLGNHSYQIVTDNTWGLDPANSDSIPNGMGGWNSLIEVKHNSPPPVIKVKQGDTEGFEIEGEYGVSVWCIWEDLFVAEIELGFLGNESLTVPQAAQLIRRSHLRLFPVNNGVRGPEILIPLEYGKPVLSTEELDRRDWHSMVMYFLMVDRFKNGMPNNDNPVIDKDIMPIANHKGGDITGVALKIADGYLGRLGVNTVWLSPITENAKGAWGYWSDPRTEVSSKFSSFHGYWPISNKKIDPAFGTRAEFNGFVDFAHSSNMNVILDYVANHVHENHPVYKNHPDWATNLYLPDGTMNTERWDDHRLTTWFDTFLPTLDLSRPEVYSAMTDSAMWWVENSAIDGFRHDATKHIPEVFWRTLTTKMKTMNRQRGRRLFQIGETYGSPSLINSYISSGMLDAQFDFNHYDAAVAALAFDDGSFENLASTARESLKYFGAHNLMGNITGNQDRIRFTSLADGGVVAEGNGKFEGWTQEINHVKGGSGFEKMRMLMSYLMAMPGVPCIYYGDEIADVGGNDPDNRRVMRFNNLSEEEEETLSHTSEWVKLRRSRMSMLYGSCEIVALSPTLLKITREYLSEKSVIYINKSSEKVELKLEGYSILAGKVDISKNENVIMSGQSAIFLGQKHHN